MPVYPDLHAKARNIKKNCHYKFHLRIKGIDGEKCNFEKYQLSEALKIKTVFFKEILKTSWNCNDGYESQKLEDIQGGIPS